MFGFSSRRLFLNQQVQIYFSFKALIQEPMIQGLLKGLKDMKREKFCSNQNPKTFKILYYKFLPARSEIQKDNSVL